MDTIRINMKKLILALLAILLMLIVSPSAYAKDEYQGLKINDHTKFELKLDEDTQQFEISGEITAIAGNNFVVSGQTIFIDPTQVREFEQKGVLAVGKRVKVEGIIKNGVKFAQEINVIGTGQGRFKFETEDHPLSFGTTASSNIQVKIKANGPIQQVETFLEQILALLKSFIS